MTLNSIKNTVLELLKTDERTKKDDLYLLAKVIEIATADDKKYTEEIKQFCNVLKEFKSIVGDINIFTVHRTRQKLQEVYPNLVDEETAEKRNKYRKDVEQFLIEDFINDNAG